MANYWCEPTWHIGMAKFPAEFLILPLPEERNFSMGSFACCQRHVGRAVNQMLERYTTVTIHRVHNEDEHILHPPTGGADLPDT